MYLVDQPRGECLPGEIACCDRHVTVISKSLSLGQRARHPIGAERERCISKRPVDRWLMGDHEDSVANGRPAVPAVREIK